MASVCEETLSHRDMMMVLSLLVRDMVLVVLLAAQRGLGAAQPVGSPYVSEAEARQAGPFPGGGEGAAGWGLLSAAVAVDRQGLVEGGG